MQINHFFDVSILIFGWGGAIEGSLLSIEDSLKGFRLGEGGVKVGV
jgi:hypothetical protein